MGMMIKRPAKISRAVKAALVCLVAAFFVVASVSFYYSIPPGLAFTTLSKSGGYVVLSMAYNADMDDVQTLTEKYHVGYRPENDEITAQMTWQQQKGLRLLGCKFSDRASGRVRVDEIPFVYQSPDSVGLQKFREQYQPMRLISDKKTEYEKMITIAEWLGTRWDHGTDPVPGGAKNFALTEIISAGENGAKFWCEIAAEAAVKTASAMNWPARLVTISRDGYTWEHAVAEYWSNDHEKWFVVDTDFNVLYQSDGIPLSAFELCHNGPDLKQTGQLEVVHFAKPKKSLPYKDMIPYYTYIHIDMRNDWNTRKLKRGSPAGGDLATWWTKRDSMDPVLSVKKRVDDISRFNWEVNTNGIYLISCIQKNNGVDMQIGFSGYSPYFENWLVSMDGITWQEMKHSKMDIHLKNGNHAIFVKMALSGGNTGPASYVKFSVNQGLETM